MSSVLFCTIIESRWLTQALSRHIQQSLDFEDSFKRYCHLPGLLNPDFGRMLIPRIMTREYMCNDSEMKGSALLKGCCNRLAIGRARYVKYFF